MSKLSASKTNNETAWPAGIQRVVAKGLETAKKEILRVLWHCQAKWGLVGRGNLGRLKAKDGEARVAVG